MWAYRNLWYNRHMGHPDRYIIALGERGRLVLPAALRRRLDLHPGDRLIATVDEGGFHVVSAREQAGRLYALYRDLAPGRSRADELIVDRREEARPEDPRWQSLHTRSADIVGHVHGFVRARVRTPAA